MEPDDRNPPPFVTVGVTPKDRKESMDAPLLPDLRGGSEDLDPLTAVPSIHPWGQDIHHFLYEALAAWDRVTVLIILWLVVSILSVAGSAFGIYGLGFGIVGMVAAWLSIITASMFLCRCGNNRRAVIRNVSVMAWWSFGIDLIATTWGIMMYFRVKSKICSEKQREWDNEHCLDNCNFIDFLHLETNVSILPMIAHTVLTVCAAITLKRLRHRLSHSSLSVSMLT